MKKQAIQKKPSPRAGETDTRITSAEGALAGPPVEAASPEGSAAGRWLVLLGLVLLGAGIVIGAYFWQASALPGAAPPAKAKRKKPSEVWKAHTAEEQIVDRFVRLREANDKAALDLLGPPPVFDGQPLSEEESEVRATDHFLRSDLRITGIRRGEPDVMGVQQATPNRFTLITQGNVSSPPMRVRTEKGVEPPGQILMNNPDLVIEVRAGRIHGLRSELHREP
jgi:hypothetical protein